MDLLWGGLLNSSRLVFDTGVKFRSGSNSNLDAVIEATNGLFCRSIADSTVYVDVRAKSFTTTSSRRYKENIQFMTEDEASKILKIEPVTFDYINKENGTDCRGVIAEDVYDIIPSVVCLDEDGNPDSVDYSKFVPYLIKMIQMQQEQINTLLQERKE